MKLGAMNDPRRNLLDEIEWIGEHQFDFLDLNIEPPKAYIGDIEIFRIREVLAKYDLSVVGHTYCIIPIGSPLRAIRESALTELGACLNVFAELGVSKVTVHLDSGFAMCPPDKTIEYNIEILKRLAEKADKFGIKIIVEHFKGLFSESGPIEKILKAIPEVGFHLDVGHANLFGGRNRAEEFIEKFHDRLEHVHFSDNKGTGDDQHLPVGAGNINWRRVIKTLKKYGYDGTITLEVFTEFRDYVLLSKRLVERLWSEVRV
jgi:sugar phosphate isomerase/epimerase